MGDATVAGMHKSASHNMIQQMELLSFAMCLCVLSRPRMTWHSVSSSMSETPFWKEDPTAVLVEDATILTARQAAS